MNAKPECTCPRIMIEDDPCPVHGYPKCEDCGRDVHDFISCEAVRQMEDRATTSPRRGDGDVR